MSQPNVTRVQSATEWTAWVHTLHMSKPNVTRVQSATEWTASVHTLHMSTPNVTCVQSATEWTAWVHTSHMSKPNVTRDQSATEWTASVHTSHMSKPNVTRVQSATGWTASVHTLHMSKAFRNGLLRYILYTCPNFPTECNSCSKCYGMDCFGTYFTHRYLDLRRYLRRVATFQATFKGSGPKGRDLPSYLRRVATFQATFEGLGPLKVPSKVPLKVPSKVCTSEGRSPSTFSTSPPPPVRLPAQTFVEGLKGPDLRTYLRRRVLTDYPKEVEQYHQVFLLFLHEGDSTKDARNRGRYMTLQRSP